MVLTSNPLKSKQSEEFITAKKKTEGETNESRNSFFTLVDFDKTDYSPIGGVANDSLNQILKPWEYLVTPDHFGYWKRHVAWATSDGKTLREQTTQRFASSMVFTSLLLNAELAILFDSCDISTRVRDALLKGAFYNIEFAIGCLIITSAFLTLFAILATFTVWGMVSSLSAENCLSVLRCSIGQYATQLPSRLVATSLWMFLTWMALFLFVLLPKWIAAALLGLFVFLYLHIVHVYSTFGRLLMHSGAMAEKPIFDSKEENSLLPQELCERLGKRAEDQFKKRVSVTAQYRDLPAAEYESDSRLRRKSKAYQDMFQRVLLTRMGSSVARDMNQETSRDDDEMDSSRLDRVQKAQGDLESGVDKNYRSVLDATEERKSTLPSSMKKKEEKLHEGVPERVRGLHGPYPNPVERCQSDGISDGNISSRALRWDLQTYQNPTISWSMPTLNHSSCLSTVTEEGAHTVASKARTVSTSLCSDKDDGDDVSTLGQGPPFASAINERSATQERKQERQQQQQHQRQHGHETRHENTFSRRMASTDDVQNEPVDDNDPTMSLRHRASGETHGMISASFVYGSSSIHESKYLLGEGS